MSSSTPFVRSPQGKKVIDHFTQASSLSERNKPDDQLTYLHSAKGKGSRSV